MAYKVFIVFTVMYTQQNAKVMNILKKLNIISTIITLVPLLVSLYFLSFDWNELDRK